LELLLIAVWGNMATRRSSVMVAANIWEISFHTR
jgi:hypothetical protein